MKLIKNLLLSLGTFLVLFLVLELSMRLFVSHTTIYDMEMHKYAKYLKRKSAIPGLSHEHIPGKSTELMGVNVSINNLGFREDDFDLGASQAEREYRILVIGSSITMGWGVAQNQVFTELVEARMQDEGIRKAGRKINIINAGIGNYNTKLQVTLLESIINEIQPHYVVLHYFINDAEFISDGDQFWLIRESYLAAFLYVRYQQAMVTKLEGVNTLGDYYSRLYEANSKSLLEVQAYVHKAQHVASANGSLFAVLIQPELNDVDPDSPQEKSYDILRNFLKAQSIPYYDVVSYFRNTSKDLKEFWIQEDDTHPNAEGHKNMATALYNAFFEWGIASEPAN